MVKLLHEVVKLLRGGADAEEDRNFNEDKECAEDQTDGGEHNSLGEEVCYAECNTEDHCEDARPLPIDTKVPCLELPLDVI